MRARCIQITAALQSFVVIGPKMNTASCVCFSLVVVLLGLAENRVIKRNADVKNPQVMALLNKTDAHSILQMFLHHLQHNSTEVPQDIIDKFMEDNQKSVSRGKREFKDILFQDESLLKWLIGCGCIKALFNVTDNKIKELPTFLSKLPFQSPYFQSYPKLSTSKSTQGLRLTDVTLQDRFDTDNYQTSPTSIFTGSQSQSKKTNTVSVAPTDVTKKNELEGVQYQISKSTQDSKTKTDVITLPITPSIHPQTSESGEIKVTTRVPLEATDNGLITKINTIPHLTTKKDKQVTTSTTLLSYPRVSEYLKVKSVGDVSESSFTGDEQLSSSTIESNAAETATEGVTVENTAAGRIVHDSSENKSTSTKEYLLDNKATSEATETRLNESQSVPVCMYTTAFSATNSTKSKIPAIRLCTTQVQRETITQLANITTTQSTPKDEKTTTSSTNIKLTALNPSSVESEVRQLFSTQLEKQTTILMPSKSKKLNVNVSNTLRENNTTEIPRLEDTNIVKANDDQTTNVLESSHTTSTSVRITLDVGSGSETPRISDVETTTLPQTTMTVASATEPQMLKDKTNKPISNVIYSKSTNKMLTEEPLVITALKSDLATFSKIGKIMPTTKMIEVTTPENENRSGQASEDSQYSVQAKQSIKLSTLPELISSSLALQEKIVRTMPTSTSSIVQSVSSVSSLSSTTERAESKSTTELDSLKSSTSNHQDPSTKLATAKPLVTKLSNTTSASPQKCMDFIKLCKCGQGVSLDGLISYLIKKIFDGISFNWKTPTNGQKVLINASYPYKIAYENDGRVPTIYFYV